MLGDIASGSPPSDPVSICEGGGPNNHSERYLTLGPFFKLRLCLVHLRAIAGGGIVLYAVLVSFNWFHGYARQNGGLVGVQGMLRPSDHYYPHLVCFTFHTPVLFETTTHLHRMREIGTVRPEGDFTRRILSREEIEREEDDFMGRVVPRDLPGQLQRYCTVSNWTAELAISLWKPHLEDRQRTVRLVGLGVPMLAASAEEPVWPLRRFYMDSLGPVPIVDGPKPAWNDCPDSPSQRVLAWRPIWMTFLPAWAIVSLAWLGIENGFVYTFLAMLKRIREQRGQCYGCGYPIDTGRDPASAPQLTRCPECGNSLHARSRTPPPPWWLRRRLWTGVAVMLARVIGAGAALYITTWLCNFLPAPRQRPELIAVHDAVDRADSEYVVGLMTVYRAKMRASAMVQLHFNSAKYLGDRMRPIWLSELPVACEQLPGALPGEPALWLELQNPSKLVRWMTILGWPVPMLSGVSSDFTGAKVVGVVDLPRSQTIPGAPHAWKMNVVDTGPESPQATPRERAESEFGPAGSDPELPRTLVADGWFELPAEPRRILAWMPIWRNFLPAWGITRLLWAIVEILAKRLRRKQASRRTKPAT